MLSSAHFQAALGAATTLGLVGAALLAIRVRSCPSSSLGSCASFLATFARRTPTPASSWNRVDDLVVRTDVADRELRDRVEALIRVYEHFPKQGVVFRDVLTVFRDADAAAALYALLLRHIRANHDRVDAVVALEARGFIIGPVLALHLGCAFVPVRKPGKLPGRVVSAKYAKEYGADGFEMQEGAVRPGDAVVLVDDLLATGGSLRAAKELVSSLGAVVAEDVVIVELTQLRGRAALVGVPVWSALQF